MSDYRKIAEEALRKSKESKLKQPKKISLNESLLYPDGLKERMSPDLENQLINGETSLGKDHPIFPEGDETSFEQKIMGERFSEVTNRYKRAYGVNTINPAQVISEMMPLVRTTMELEANHRKELEDLAVKMIREEYDMPEDVVEINAVLTKDISIEGTKKNATPQKYKMEFESHAEMVNANDEVYKRRFINAMTQGAAKKCNHMFHLVEDEVGNLEPKLNGIYSKLMSSADYMYYLVPNMDEGINGGVVRVKFPNKDNPKLVIDAQAMVFPVLIHELVKGVMEILSAHGLPKKQLGEYVISKADFLSAEPWDMRMGPALWGRFTDMIDADDFNLKHHIYSELVALPVKEFNEKMKEIMAGTKEGKKIIKDIVKIVKSDMENDEFNQAMDEVVVASEEKEEGFDWKELLGENPDSDEDDGFDFKELF